jgi:hypothetical protein
VLGQLLATFRFLEFFLLKLVYFEPKEEKNIYGCFFHSFCATDHNVVEITVCNMDIKIVKGI